MPGLELEQELFGRGYLHVAGVDEAGRGPLAGPVVAGAVILPPGLSSVPPWLAGVDDSKKLSPRQRRTALECIRYNAVAVGVGMASAAEIDYLGIGPATKRAMLRALEALPMDPDHLLIDYVPLSEAGTPFLALIGGDGRSYSIAAASIVAKVTRDSLMEEADLQYPAYGFARHKGYGTALHMARLSVHGPCPLHRRSFAPVREIQGQMDR